ncbi:mandelate racemase/muconate lactonizing enzyme family protein [Desulfosporosinus fructosivorans]|uniref:Mandelate racemase/muconate lactonizing enzyme family protein n=1 Tax=Desulfosporosinus fructosivorans TaxID=2018669 RepID=A0A4Z0RB03_9FIRM|nr:mandelate racemase/muconate lactonizing enzyme family protein [Desulfosporosinus fructosivorans]TGE39347.1 mandelate racemase/muconate lactonizing enzyme family protein [Desulfosporosinus fructosivorans]
MKISSVDVIQCNCLENPAFRPIICRINTDEGIYGYGEAAVAYGTGAPAAFGMIKDFATLIIGKDPMNIEAIWDTLMKTTFWGQGGGTIIFAGISAIDMALWDIKGKVFGVPIYKLLGGKTNSKLRTYASQLQLGWDKNLKIGWGQACEPGSAPERYAETAKIAISQGYDCIKIDFLNYNRQGFAHTHKQLTKPLTYEVMHLAEERLTAVREAVGNEVDIIIENHCGTDAVSAVQFGRLAEKFNIFYYEEPVTPLNPEMTKYVAERVKIPIAQGERIYGRWAYIPFLKDHSVQVIQPDIGNCGGITEAKKICDMAHAYDVSVQTHVCGSPIAKAAALQLETTLPNFLIHEHHVINMAPYITELGVYDYQPVNGYYTVPEVPGIGQELSQKALDNADIVTVK